MRKICVITGSRAEYGLLSGLMTAIKKDPTLLLQVIATNMHLSPEFGLTYKEIENDGFTIDKKVEMLLSSDTSNGTTKSVGLATIGFADAYEDIENEDFDFLNSNKIPNITYLSLANTKVKDNAVLNRIKSSALDGKTSLKNVILPKTVEQM